MKSKSSLWRRLFGSMRPLHVQSNKSPPTVSKPKEDFMESPKPLPLPSSPFSCASSSSSFGTSQYTSATNLKELDDNSEGSDDENAIKDDKGGDEMIDAKAEEFIAQFYEQMRRQRHNY